MIQRLVQEIADSCAEWPGQDEDYPEQQCPGRFSPEINGSNGCDARGEDDGAAAITEPGGIRHPVAERCSQRLREQDRDPIEGLRRLVVDRCDGVRPCGSVPNCKRGSEQTCEQR